MLNTVLSASAGGIWSTLQEVTDGIVSEKLGGFRSVAVVLAAMLAAFTVIKNSSDYIQGDSRFLWPVLRPLVILICVMEFPLACGLLDGLVNVFTRDIAGLTESSFADLGSAVDDAFEELEMYTMTDAVGNAVDAEQEDWGFWKKMKEGVLIAARSYLKKQQVSGMAVMAFVARVISELIFFVYEILAALYLGLLKLMGPLTLALAIPEGMKGGVSAWISRYLQISLWIPVGYLIIMFITGFFKGICDLIISGEAVSTAVFIGAAFIIAIISAIMSIPKIASWPIQSSGAANANASMNQALGTLLRKVIK